MAYSMDKTVSGRSFEEVVARTREALQSEGFGVLTEIDVKATLKKKLDVDVPSYLILGACNPPLAHKVLELEPRIGVLLPCNVVVRELGDGKIEVSAMDPAAAMQVVENAAVQEVAAEVRDRLARVMAAI